MLAAAKQFEKAMKDNSRSIDEVRQLQNDIIRNMVQRNLLAPPDTADTADKTEEGKDGQTKEENSNKGLQPVLMVNGKSIPIPAYTSTQSGQRLQKLMHDVLETRMQLELNFIATIEAIFQLRPETAQLLNDRPDIVNRIKNHFLNLDAGDYDAIMDKLSQMSLLPSLEPPKGNQIRLIYIVCSVSDLIDLFFFAWR